MLVKSIDGGLMLHLTRGVTPMSNPIAPLVAFLHARIAEDEHAAKCDRENAVEHAHLTTTPARVLADCDAKRGIVRECVRFCDDPFGNVAGTTMMVGMYALESLALPYADHPDYDEEWRP